MRKVGRTLRQQTPWSASLRRWEGLNEGCHLSLSLCKFSLPPCVIFYSYPQAIIPALASDPGLPHPGFISHPQRNSPIFLSRVHSPLVGGRGAGERFRHGPHARLTFLFFLNELDVFQINYPSSTAQCFFACWGGGAQMCQTKYWAVEPGNKVSLSLVSRPPLAS